MDAAPGRNQITLTLSSAKAALLPAAAAAARPPAAAPEATERQRT